MAVGLDPDQGRTFSCLHFRTSRKYAMYPAFHEVGGIASENRRSVPSQQPDVYRVPGRSDRGVLRVSG